MNIDKALAQLADPNTSGADKRKILDKLKEATTQTEQDPTMSALLGLGLGVAGGAAGGALGRLGAKKLAQGSGADALEIGMITNMAGLSGAPKWALPGSMRKAAGDLTDNILGKGGYDTTRAAVDAATALGAAGGAGHASNFVGSLGSLTNNEVRAQDPEAAAALERIASGSAAADDAARFKKYYEGVQDSGGGLGTFLGQTAAGAAAAIPTLWFGGPAAGRLARKLKVPGFSTPAGKELAGEIGFDAAAGSALGGAAGAATYNAMTDPYEDPF